jgi:SAM-dependent methyltransferase
MSPLCESYVDRDALNAVERFYPLKAWVCESCLLVQLDEYVSPEDIFSEYAYFSSYSDSWVAHARAYTQMAIRRFGLGPRSHVVEVASNDGYLLQHFVHAGIPCLGVEPALNVARAAEERGVTTLTSFFGVETARMMLRSSGPADLVVANNVLAQVPDLADFVGGMKLLLAPGGTVTFEFPHLLRLMQENQFDTIYHEHFSYFSLLATTGLLARHGLEVVDVEELPTHGGSLRVFAAHQGAQEPSPAVDALLGLEREAGLDTPAAYGAFRAQVERTKRGILRGLSDIKDAGQTIVGYGAPGKGNTLLNYCGIRTDFLDYTVDRNPYKQGKYLPGTHIPIFSPGKIDETRPDYIFILPWNLTSEIVSQLAYTRSWGCKFIVPIPQFEVLP